MTVLKNARWEKVLHNVINGMPRGPAWTAAGYKATGNAAEVACARTFRNAKVQERYAELQGRNAKQITDVRDAARQHTQAAVRTLVSVMQDATAPPSARVAAANGLLDRGHGKAVQHIEANVNVYDALSLADKQTLLEVLDALAGDEDGDETRH